MSLAICTISRSTAVSAERQVFGFLFRDSPDTILHRSRQVMGLYVEHLHRLAGIAGEHAADFRSEGFTRFFAMLASELDDDYFAEMEERLAELEFRRGKLMSARLGRGGKGIGLRAEAAPAGSGWRDRLRGRNRGGLHVLPSPNGTRQAYASSART